MSGKGAKSILAMAGMAVALLGSHAALAQKGPRHPTALIPFEQERAQDRGDRATLLLNEDASRIPGHRIMELPIVNGKMGEHAKLDDGVEIFFPFGRILTATTELHKYKSLSLGSESREFSPDPRYKRVNQFDRVLGSVCASEGISPDSPLKIELRMGENNRLSLVRMIPPEYKNPEDSDAVSYRVTSAMEIRHLARQEPEAEKLYRNCLRGKSDQKVSSKD
ncbi:hypothetical protein [Ferrovibrio sp.]|uniref:hypothetical protein n=1 Tax=Ferrovibrio sp. TaxID=1917215 RepID=UPI0035AF1638